MHLPSPCCRADLAQAPHRDASLRLPNLFTRFAIYRIMFRVAHNAHGNLPTLPCVIHLPCDRLRSCAVFIGDYRTRPMPDCFKAATLLLPYAYRQVCMKMPPCSNLRLGGNAITASAVCHNLSNHLVLPIGTRQIPLACFINLYAQSFVWLKGGFIQTVPCQSCTKPSSSCV